jgi:CHASE3 domain sensor protein
MKLRRTMQAAIAIPVVLLAVIALLLAWEIRELVGHGAAVSHTEQVKGAIFEAQKLLVDQETGLRAYFLVRDTAVLEPYRLGGSALPATLGALRNLVSDNPSQQRRVDEITGRFQKWRAAAETAREQAAVAPPPSFPGVSRDEIYKRKKEMDAMRALAHSMIAEEDRLVAIRRARLDQWTRLIMISTVVVLLIFALLLATLLRRWIAQIDASYSAALRDAQEAQRLAETFANECLEQSRDFEQRFLALSQEHEDLLKLR